MAIRSPYGFVLFESPLTERPSGLPEPHKNAQHEAPHGLDRAQDAVELLYLEVALLVDQGLP